MTRVFDKDKIYTKMNPEKIIKRFCEKYGKQEWIEVFEWMLETGIEHYADTKMAGGLYNPDWCYSLWLELDENYTYICLIERA